MMPTTTEQQMFETIAEASHRLGVAVLILGAICLVSLIVSVALLWSYVADRRLFDAETTADVRQLCGIVRSEDEMLHWMVSKRDREWAGSQETESVRAIVERIERAVGP